MMRRCRFAFLNPALALLLVALCTETLGLDVIWAGIALGVAAGLEIPAIGVVAPTSRSGDGPLKAAQVPDEGLLVARSPAAR